jgi:hypothetical protein
MQDAGRQRYWKVRILPFSFHQETVTTFQRQQQIWNLGDICRITLVFYGRSKVTTVKEITFSLQEKISYHGSLSSTLTRGSGQMLPSNLAPVWYMAVDPPLTSWPIY